MFQCRGIDPVAKTIDIVAHYGVVRGGSAEEANPGTKRLHTLKYDALVIAVGARNNTFGIPGVEYAPFYSISVKRRCLAKI